MKPVRRCIVLVQLLVEQNFPAIAIHRGMPQEERYTGHGEGLVCPWENKTMTKREGTHIFLISFLTKAFSLSAV